MKSVKIFTLAICSFLFIFSCKKEDTYTSTGTIFAKDSTECACCGGWFINIDSDSTIYRFHGLPAEKDIDMAIDTIYPINVELDWGVAANSCNLANEIIITRIRRK